MLKFCVICGIKFNMSEYAIIISMYIYNKIFRWSFPRLLQQWTMTIVDRSTEKSDHESVGCKQSPFSSGDVRMDSSWTVGPAKPSDSLRVKAPGCLGSASGAAVFNTTPSTVDRPKEQGGQVAPSVTSPKYTYCIIYCQYIQNMMNYKTLQHIE